jgi:hypothetical protein
MHVKILKNDHRLGTGLSYSIVYSTLLVKLVFLVSLNSGVYLPATYQALLLCFAVLIQLVIGKIVFFLVFLKIRVYQYPGLSLINVSLNIVFGIS